MLRIGICDENTKDRTVIRQIVTDTLFREEELSYIEYAEAETLEQEIQASTVPFDLLLMEMKYKIQVGYSWQSRYGRKIWMLICCL